MSTIKCVFFDAKDTLGYVDSPGNIIIFKPSTLRLLETTKETLLQRLGIITNLPESLSAEQGREMLQNAGLMEWIDPDLVIINHEAQHDKPEQAIYEYAAQKAGLQTHECLFIGENLIEVMGAQNAGMKAILKPFPPGREFQLKPQRAMAGRKSDSGRISEVIMEEDHLISKRIVMSTAKIVTQLQGGKVPFKAMSLLVYLTKHFVDKYHHRKEEEVLFPLSIAAGVKPEVVELALKDHDQGRHYFKGMEVALGRYSLGHQAALEDFRLCATGFVELYKIHGKMEDDVVLPEIGKYLSDLDDAIIVDLFDKIGPPDLTPYLLLISSLEKEADKLNA